MTGGITRQWIALLLVTALSLSVGAQRSWGQKDKKQEKQNLKNLDTTYREWLEREVVYIITKEERDAFLHLNSNEGRDKFIDWFWAIRNADSDSPRNTYREEHYRRLAYAEDHFSIGKRVPGWATDRGRIYIVLGPPKQMADYKALDRVRPMQIWFYESATPALPPYFYVVFYKKDSFGDYVTYSPYFDGPQELVTERGVTDVQAIQMIHRDAGQEVAHVALTLLPDEPADTQNPRPSMQSDVMMSVIHDLANSPSNLEALQRHAMMLSVTSRLLVGGETLGFLTAPLRDAEGNVKLHYLLRLKKPEDFALGLATDGTYYFSVEARAEVYGPDDKLIFTQERFLKKPVSPEMIEHVKNTVFGYEGWLPLPPGKYHVKFTLSNVVNSVGYQAETNVVVPEAPSSGLGVTPLIPFSSVQSIQPELSGLVPFSVAGLKFSPLLPRELNFSPATNLQFFYQIWAAHDEIMNTGAGDLETHYAFGRPGIIGQAKVIDEAVARQQIDPTGTLLTGEKIPLGDWPQGNYLLTMSVNAPGSPQKASGSLTFRLLADPQNPSDWDIFDGEGIAKDVKNGTSDFQRGLCYLAFGEKDSAAKWFRSALEKNPRQEEARSALVNLEFGRSAFPLVAQLARDVPITADTDDETILRLGDALDRTGSTQEAVDLLQSAIKLKAPSGPMYLTLASYYRRMGDARKGDDFEKKGKELVATAHPAPPVATKN